MEFKYFPILQYFDVDSLLPPKQVESRKKSLVLLNSPMTTKEKEKPVSRVAILGTPVSSQNRGVLALGASLVNLCVQGANGGQVSLMLGHHNSEPIQFRIAGEIHSIQVVNCQLSPLAINCLDVSS